MTQKPIIMLRVEVDARALRKGGGAPSRLFMSGLSDCLVKMYV